MSLLVVIDLETTDLSPERGCVWDIGAVAVRDGQILGEFESLVRPHADRFQRGNREVVRKVSGLDDAGLLALFDAPPVDRVTQNFLGWLFAWTQHETVVTLTSFNLQFDAGYLAVDPWNLTQEFERRIQRRAQWGPCVMEACCQPMGEAGLLQRGRYGDRWLWPKLTAACEFFDVEFVETHRAKADALAAARLAIKLGLSGATAVENSAQLALL